MTLKSKLERMEREGASKDVLRAEFDKGIYACRENILSNFENFLRGELLDPLLVGIKSGNPNTQDEQRFSRYSFIGVRMSFEYNLTLEKGLNLAKIEYSFLEADSFISSSQVDGIETYSTSEVPKNVRDRERIYYNNVWGYGVKKSEEENMRELTENIKQAYAIKDLFVGNPRFEEIGNNNQRLEVAVNGNSEKIKTAIPLVFNPQFFKIKND